MDLIIIIIVDLEVGTNFLNIDIFQFFSGLYVKPVLITEKSVIKQKSLELEGVCKKLNKK